VQAINKDFIIVRNTNHVGTGNIFIFDRNGKALRKINRRGQSNEEYTNIAGLITLDEDNRGIFVSCPGLKKVFVYDLFGNFKRNFNYIEGGEDSDMFKIEIQYNPVYNFDEDHLILHDNSSGRNFFGWDDNGPQHIDEAPRNIFFIISKHDGSLKKEIQIPFEKKIFQMIFLNNNIGIVNNPGLIPYGDRWLLVEPSADTIYTYSIDHQMEPFIVRKPSVQSMDPEVFLFPGVITDRYCFMQTVKKEFDETDPHNGLLRANLVYDKQEKKHSNVLYIITILQTKDLL